MNREDDALYKTAVSCLDLTLLDKSASASELDRLVDKAVTNNVAAVCVFPQHLPSIKTAGGCLRVTVVNFPDGEDKLDKTLSDIEAIVSTHHPDEIDYVFPYQTCLNGQQTAALMHCERACQAVKLAGLKFKVILETSAFHTPEAIYQLSREIIKTDCDFLKTSTGKSAHGATPLAVYSMLRAMQDSEAHCGIKVSGGIKTSEQAFLYMNLATSMLGRKADKSWFRIGASRLFDVIS